MSFFYFRRSQKTGHVQPPAWLTPIWALKAQRGELPEFLARLFRNAFDSDLTGGAQHDAAALTECVGGLQLHFLI